MRLSTAAPISLALASALACASANAPEAPGARLQTRVEAYLRQHQDSLKDSLVHYGLVFPVEQADLINYLRPIRFHSSGGDLALGTDYTLEPHGGGILRLIFDHWRPESRSPRMSDRFRFEASRESLELGEIYRAQRAQVFLPVPGMQAGDLGGRLPSTPQLPRMRMPLPLPDRSKKFVERDAYKMLGLLIEHEPDPSRAWMNHVGQPLSVDLLMHHARDHYLNTSDTPGEPPDHSSLHLVELLLAYDRQRELHEADAIKSHFLATEMARRDFEPEDEAELLAHHAESLGHLVADPDVHWSRAEWHRVKAWLLWLEQDRFSDLAELELPELAHLLRGLRLIEAHHSRMGTAAMPSSSAGR